MKALADAPVRRWSWKAPISAMQHPHSKADVWKLVRAAYPSPRYGSPTCWLDLRAGVVWIRLWHDAREPHHPAAAACSSRSEMRSAHPHTL